ncbi:MAG: hypothetical protein IH951_05510 [Bacteroidetes bacterium]|nr:hypothetical protein [Bacteroidota bacterium]
MKNILMTVVAVSFLASCELVSEPPVSSESPPIADRSDASQSTSELFLGKKPMSSGVEYEVTAVADPDTDPLILQLESRCPGFADSKFHASWFTHDCEGENTPFNYYTGSHIFAGNGLLNLVMKKKTFRFWLWDARKGSDIYDTGTLPFSDGDIDPVNPDGSLSGGFTFHIDAALEMTRKVKKEIISAGIVEFGDVVYTLK